MNEKFRKVFAFYGEDLDNYKSDIIRDVHNDGFTILALDVYAVGKAMESTVPYTVVDDWLDKESFEKAMEKAAYCRENWYADFHSDFCVNGICWPEFDSHAMYWSWFEICFAEAISFEFLRREIEELLIFKRPISQPSVYYYSQDVGKEVIISILKDKVTVYHIFEQKSNFLFNKIRSGISLFRHIKSNLQSNLKLNKEHNNQFDNISNKIIIAINPGEADRFSSIVETLKKNQNVVGVVAALTSSQIVADNLSKRWNIPVIKEVQSNGPTSDVQNKLLDTLKKVKLHSRGKPWEKALDILDFHFNYYCSTRWPELNMTYQSWHQLFRNSRPTAVIVSSIQDAESNLVTMAANHLNIPTFSIPHGLVQQLPKITISKYIFYGIFLQRTSYENIGVLPWRLLPSKEAYIVNEYTVRKHVISRHKGVLNIVVLTSGIGMNGLITFGINGQLHGLNTLNNVPSDLKDDISIHFKTHPSLSFCDHELFKAAGIDIEKHLLPLDSDLLSVLEDCDLVIMLNNLTSSSIIHAIKAEIPILYYKAALSYSKPISMHPVPPHITIYTADELWCCIRRFMNDKDFEQEVRDISHTFNKLYLDNSDYPTIIDHIIEKTG